MQTWQVHCGDALTVLKTLPGSCVDCVVTSPPYFGLRDYQTGSWVGGDDGCDHAPRAQLRGTTNGDPSAGTLRDKPTRVCKCGAERVDKQIGLEPTPAEYVGAIVEVFREVRRVLVDAGSIWINIGDSFAGSWGNQGRTDERGTQRPINGGMLTQVHDGRYPSQESNTGKVPNGLKPKDLIGIPWSVAFALRSDGWYLRSEIIWHKKSCMPESVKDRPTKAHEQVFLLTKRAKYFYDQDAIREKYAESTLEQIEAGYDGEGQKDYASAGVQNPSSVKARTIESARERYRYARIPVQSAHGYTTRGDSDCGTPILGANARSVWSLGPEPATDIDHFAVMPKTLARRCILAGCPFGGTVLDPFAGSGTTGIVALEEGRSFIGIELNPQYHALARQRLGNTAPLLAHEISA